MILENNEYRVKEMDGLKTITITKEALEEWRDHYNKNVLKVTQEWQKSFYMGKADALTEILKHFEEE